MFEVNIDGKNESAEMTFETAVIYEQQFGSDMLADLYGKQNLEDDEFAKVDENDNIVSLDFSKIGWTTLLKILWAALKAASPKTPAFQAWSKKTGGVNMFDVRIKLAEAVYECFFRVPAEDVEQG